MLSETLKQEIYETLPKTFIVGSTTISPTFMYANQFDYEKYPAITLNYFDLGTVSWVPVNYVIEVQNIDQEKDDETKTFHSGTSSYILDNGFITSIDTVSGTVSGSPYTFSSADYEISENKTSILFTGTTLPDDNTDFAVDYKYRMLKRVLGGVYEVMLAVNIYDIDYRDPSLSSIKIVDTISQELQKWFEYQFCDEIENINTGNISEIRNEDEAMDGKYRRRRVFEVIIRYPLTYEKEQIPIGPIEVDVKV